MYGLFLSNSFYNQAGEYITVKLYKKDYVGASTERDMGGSPARMTLYSQGDSRWKGIKGASATVQFISLTDYEFSDIFTAENYTYLLTIQKGLGATEVISNRDFLANIDNWTVDGFTWSQMGLYADQSGSDTAYFEQTITMANGTYNVIIDYSGSTVATEYLEMKFNGATVTNHTLSSTGGRITYSWVYAGGSATATIRFTKKLGIGSVGSRFRVNNIDILKSGNERSLRTLFVGHVMQESYIEPEVSAPYVVEISASNGLGNLKNEIFESAVDTPYLGQKQILDTVNTILQKAQLYLPVYIGIDIYDLTNDTDGDDPFAVKWINMEQFEGMDCYEVLEIILKPFLLQIKQVDATWQITKITNTPYDIAANLYDTYNNLLGTATLNYVRASDSSNRLALHDHTIEIVPALKRYNIIENRGERTNIINTNFEKDWAWVTDTELLYWIKYPTASLTYQRMGFDFDGTILTIKTDAVHLDKYYNYTPNTDDLTARCIYSEETPDIYDAGDKIQLKITFDYYFIYPSGPFPTGSTYLGYHIGQPDGNNEITLDNAVWIEITEGNSYQWKSYESFLTLTPENVSRGLIMRLYYAVNTLAATALDWVGVYYKNVNVQVVSQSSYTTTTKVVININNNKTGDNIELNICDLPDESFNKWKFLNGLHTGENGAVAIGSWAIQGESTSAGSLVDIIQNAISLNEATPKQLFRGSLLGAWELSDVFEFTSNSNKRYLITGGTLDLKQSILNGEFAEMYYYTTTPPTNYLMINAVDFLLINETDFLEIN